MRHKITTLALAASALFVAAPAAQATPERAAEPDSVVAVFEGERFNMADGWGTPEVRPEIQVCYVATDAATCFRSEREMDEAIGEPPTSSQLAVAASCSSSLRLYDGTSHTGAVVAFTQRTTLISLSTVGFSNRTSSYRVGACSSRLYDGIGTSQYGGNTNAFASATSMGSWTNRISSIWIN